MLQRWRAMVTPVPISLPPGAHGQTGEGSPAFPALPWQNSPVKPGLQLQTGVSTGTWHCPWCWHGLGRQASGLLLTRRATPGLGPWVLASSPAAKERQER